MQTLKKLDRSAFSSSGAKLLDFSMKDVNGTIVDSKSFKGKYLLIVCWASWCDSCDLLCDRQYPVLHVG